MFGIVLGTVCFILLLGVMRRERWRRYGFAYGGPGFGHGHFGWGHHHHGGWGGHHGRFGHHHGYGHAGGPVGRGAMMHGMLGALETTPGQDRAIVQAFDAFFERVRSASKTREAAHAKIAAAVTADTLDAQALQAGLAHEAEVGAELRAELAAALSRVHEALDPQQRKQLAQMIEEGLLARYIGRPL